MRAFVCVRVCTCACICARVSVCSSQQEVRLCRPREEEEGELHVRGEDEGEPGAGVCGGAVQQGGGAGGVRKRAGDGGELINQPPATYLVFY